MPKPMKIDYVSDIACPWCAIGLRSLEQALANAADAVDAQIHFQPYELNPDMPAGGTNVDDYLTGKHGISPQQMAANRAGLIARATDAGFDMQMTGESRLHNTFDAHRLLHWAGLEPGLEGRQQALKNALFVANFTDNDDVADPGILLDVAEKAGLDRAATQEVLASGRYAQEVRDAEQLWQSRGIRSVPSIIINDQYLISGGQPPEVFEQALREIAAKA